MSTAINSNLTVPVIPPGSNVGISNSVAGFTGAGSASYQDTGFSVVLPRAPTSGKSVALTFGSILRHGIEGQVQFKFIADDGAGTTHDVVATGQTWLWEPTIAANQYLNQTMEASWTPPDTKQYTYHLYMIDGSFNGCTIGGSLGAVTFLQAMEIL